MTNFENKKILIIEDDLNAAQSYKFVLERSGYRNIRHADTGNAGLDLAREWRPDLVISDIMHPGLDGLSVVKDLSLNPGTLSTRFIVISGCSGEGHPDYAEKVKAAGVSVCLQKPVDLKELPRIVGEVFAQAQEETRRGL